LVERCSGGIGWSGGFGYNAAGTPRPDRDRMISRLEQLCLDKGLKMTEQRRVIARVLSDSADHPDVERVYRRATQIDPRISIATVYRTVRLFEEANILARHDFGDGRSRYEEMPSDHHDHLIDLQSGRVVEFRNEEIEKLQKIIADKLGYDLVGHRLELYALPRRGKQNVDQG
jgi:Fur family transcriptional regulator, ferric uptake regulator